MTDSEWLLNLSVGDLVVVTGSAGDATDRVERLTATQILTKRHGKFRRKDGRDVGVSSDRWSGWRLTMPTAENMYNLERKQAWAALQRLADAHAAPEHMSNGQIKAIVAQLRPPTSP
jgi:hypothetical protein